MKQQIIIITILILSSLIFGRVVLADDFFYFKTIDYPLTSDYILSSPDNQVMVKIAGDSTARKLSLKMMDFVPREIISHYFTYDSSLTPAGDLYFIRFLPAGENNFTKPTEVVMSYEPSGYYQEVYFYDWLDMAFEKLESKRDTINHTLTFDLPVREKIMFALFNKPDIVGATSWYVHPKYAGELIVASRDFAIDTKLTVTNLYNDKSVVVVVKDYGPKLCSDWTQKEQELMGPCQDRVLDLSKEAFLMLATTTGQGIISQVKVSPFFNEE